MRFLHILTPRDWCGVNQYVYNFCKEEKKRGNESYVLVDSAQMDIAKRFSEVANVLTAKTRALGGIFAYYDVKKMIRDLPLDAIFCHSSNASILSVLLKQALNIKLVFFRHNLVRNSHNRIQKWYQKNVDGYICVSKAVCNSQKDSAFKKFQDKFTVIYTGVDEENFPEISVEPRLDDEVVIGYAGRIIENKGVLILLKAYKRLLDEGYNTKLVMAGPKIAPFGDKFEATIDELDLRGKMEYLGLIKNMNKFYKSVDMFVCPTIYDEAFALVILEAMYCGLPIISTNNGGQPEVIDDGINGFLVHPENVDELYVAMKKMVDSKSLREEFSKNASKKIRETLMLEKFVNDVEKYVQDMC